MRHVITIVLLGILGLACGDSEPATAPEPAPVSTGLESEETPAADPEEEAEVEPPEAEGQSYVQALELICNEVVESDEVRDATPESKAVVMHQYITERLTNEEARELYASLAEMEAAQKHETVSNAAEEAGLSRCDIVELWAEP